MTTALNAFLIVFCAWQALHIAYTAGQVAGIRWCMKANDEVFEEIKRQKRIRELRP